jgi:hypothetical protein
MAVKDRGFASMPAQKRRDIASKGGAASHAKGVAHEWTCGGSTRSWPQRRDRRATTQTQGNGAQGTDVIGSGALLTPRCHPFR